MRSLRCDSVMMITDLVLVNLSVSQLLLALFLECDDDQGDEDVDEEEGEHDEEDYVEDGHLHSEPGDRTLVFKRRIHRIVQNAKTQLFVVHEFKSRRHEFYTIL